MTITINSLDEYQNLANRTNNYKDTPKDSPRHREGILVSAIGLIGESVEVLELFTNAKMLHDGIVLSGSLSKELGDVAWYMATACLDHNIYMSRLEEVDHLDPYGHTVDTWANLLVVAAKSYSELMKKTIGHDQNTEEHVILSALQNVYLYWVALAGAYGIPISTILAENIEKLMKRFPNGFSTEASVNRVDVDQ